MLPQYDIVPLYVPGTLPHTCAFPWTEQWRRCHREGWYQQSLSSYIHPKESDITIKSIVIDIYIYMKSTTGWSVTTPCHRNASRVTSPLWGESTGDESDVVLSFNCIPQQSMEFITYTCLNLSQIMSVNCTTFYTPLTKRTPFIPLLLYERKVWHIPWNMFLVYFFFVALRFWF